MAVTFLFTGFRWRIVRIFRGASFFIVFARDAFGSSQGFAALAGDIQRVRHGDDVGLEDVAAVFADVENFVVFVFVGDFVDVIREGDAVDAVDIFDHGSGIAPVFEVLDDGVKGFLRRWFRPGSGGERGGEEGEGEEFFCHGMAQ